MISVLIYQTESIDQVEVSLETDFNESFSVFLR